MRNVNLVDLTMDEMASTNGGSVDCVLLAILIAALLLGVQPELALPAMTIYAFNC